MSASFAGKSLALSQGAKESKKQDAFVRVRKRDLERLTTEVMQLREFLPRVLNGDLAGALRKARAAQTTAERLAQEQEQLRQERLHLRSRLDAAQAECQKEREEKLLLRQQLWRSAAELRQQADFCAVLGSAACGLLWSCSASERTVAHWLADADGGQGKLQPFLAVATQTLESFVGSLDGEAKTQTEDHDSQEHQFVLALAGTITNIAAATGGRDFLSDEARALPDTLLKLLELMEPSAFPRLKVLMLMALYNVSISVRGLRHVSENPGLPPLIRTLLDDGDWEVRLHALRLLQSVLLSEEEEEEVLLPLRSSLLDPDLRARVGQLASSVQPGLRQAAQQTLEDLRAHQQGRGCKQSSL